MQISKVENNENADYREFHRRKHCLLGAYLVIWCWKNAVDCVAIPKIQILSYLRISRWKDKRRRWLTEDLSDLFPNVKTLVGDTDVFHSIYLSRAPFPDDAFDASMTDDNRCSLMTQNGLPSAVLRETLLEREMASQIASLALGLQSNS